MHFFQNELAAGCVCREKVQKDTGKLYISLKKVPHIQYLSHNVLEIQRLNEGSSDIKNSCNTTKKSYISDIFELRQPLHATQSMSV